MTRAKPPTPVVPILLAAVGAVAAAGLEVAGGLEEFLEKFPDAAEVYFQTKTDAGVGFYTISTPSGEMTPTGILGRGMAGVAAEGVLVHEGPDADGIEDVYVRRPGAEEPIRFGGPLRDLQPCVCPGGLVAFATETEPDRFDLALWDASGGMRTLDLGCGDETEPAILYAPAGDGPVIVIFQGHVAGEFQLYYAVIRPCGTVARAERLLEFPGWALCPEVLPPSADWTPREGDAALLAFHGLAEGDQRDLYLCEVTFHGDPDDPEGVRLTAGEPERLTESPADDKYPELHRDSAGTLWCLYASFRDGDYDLYALNLDTRELYQLTDMRGTQTVPYVHRTGR
jgi:hypothetical protein